MMRDEAVAVLKRKGDGLAGILTLWLNNFAHAS